VLSRSDVGYQLLVDVTASFFSSLFCSSRDSHPQMTCSNCLLELSPIQLSKRDKPFC